MSRLKKKFSPAVLAAICKDWFYSPLTAKEICAKHGVSMTTLYKTTGGGRKPKMNK